MKFLWVLFVAAVLVAATDEGGSDESNAEYTDGTKIPKNDTNKPKRLPGSHGNITEPPPVGGLGPVAAKDEGGSDESNAESTDGTKIPKNDTNKPKRLPGSHGNITEPPPVGGLGPVAAKDEGGCDESNAESTDGTKIPIKNTDNKPKRLPGSHGNINGPAPLGGLGPVNQGFGGVNPGFGGVNPGFGGGVNPGFGGVNPGFGGPVTGGCRRWCRTPQGQAYCCENANQAASFPFVKPGQCPPVRPSCPPSRNFSGPPATCSNDSRCPGVDKCCFDTCLEEHVCKPPLGVGK